MRIGENPIRNKKVNFRFKHQIIVPIYIPNLNGYYKDSFKVLKFSIDSLIKTKSKESFITLVNNGSCIEVTNYLNELFDNFKVDEVVNTFNIGKVNAILKGISAGNYDLITISDADILFMPNWLEETLKVFNNFEKTGVVGLIPQFKMYEHCSGHTIFDNLLSAKLKFRKVKDKNGLIQFYKSIGWESNYNKDYLKYALSLKDNNIEALVGSGHAIATYRKELLTDLPLYSEYLLGGGSVNNFFDYPSEKKGLWRLTTARPYALHMGNTFDEEYNIKFNSQLDNTKIDLIRLSLNTSEFFYFIKKLFKKIIKNKKIRVLFYRCKGLDHDVSKSY